jgi:transposase-like protein
MVVVVRVVEGVPPSRVGTLGEGPQRRFAPVAIVWACQLSVEEYMAAGRGVVVPRCRCPACLAWMVFWSGYWRSVRAGGSWRIWVCRARCSVCGVSHVLLPSFCLVGRSYAVEVIGLAVSEVAEGKGTGRVARAVGVAQSTVRSWWRRHRDRARAAYALGVSVAATLGVGMAAAPSSVEMAVLADLDELAGTAHESKELARWPAVSLVTCGMWLVPVKAAGSTTSRVFRDGEVRRLMTVIDPTDGKRPP